MKKTAGFTAVCAGVLVSFPLLILIELIGRYDRFSYGRHAPLIRKVVPWRTATYLAPLLPLFALLPPYVAHHAASWPGGEVLRGLVSALLVVTALGLAEVYSVCLHREAYIAAFEPWSLPADYAPLGAQPQRFADRRLQHLARVQLLYCVPLISTACVVGPRTGLLSSAVILLFLVKYLAPAWVDFEAYFHWDMHCQVLGLRGRQWLSSVWRLLSDWVMGPMIGSLPRFYATEHLMIHHPENAGPDDIHSPLPYDRSRVLEFCIFGLKTCFILLTSGNLAFHRRCRGSRRALLVLGVAAFWAGTAYLIATDRFLGYWLVGAALYRAVNTAKAQYVWHGLSDLRNPRHPKASTILWLPQEHLVAALDHEPTGTKGAAHVTEVPVLGTDWAFYDNYHLIHHLYPRAHFTAYPELLRRTVPGLLDWGCVVMRLNVYETFVFDCWTGNFERIAQGLVTPMGDDLRLSFIRERMAPLPGHRSYSASLCEGRFGQAANSAMVRGLRLVVQIH
ncbi:fatty acid desaturase [Streptomyces lunaelactis]|uniref:fatty acid desaturase n=1 Tax=Streptomyces lunaelactis TaxID=1535768 RepID=UPI00158560D5|nr:fatty acid desaturase [Streptomyces lunaelactis]NUL07022.1 fatty acid desaturase [Streptomyces lunaelactis]